MGELHLAHFAWTDASRRTFRYEEKTHLGLPGIASAETGRLEVANEDWSAVESQGVHRIHAAGRDWELSLTLLPRKAPVIHGENGISKKGPGESDYSRYVSITRLAASGSMRNQKVTYRLSGTAWFDHEWGPGALPEGAVGWDWFALQLSDGSDLMLYRMRGAGGGATPYSSGTFVPVSGEPSRIRWRDVRLEETGEWVSPKTRARYPSGWRLTADSLSLDVAIAPVLQDQELVTSRSTGVTYWEGACRVRGTRGGKPIEGRAYVELTGYAGKDVPGSAALNQSGPRTIVSLSPAGWPALEERVQNYPGEASVEAPVRSARSLPEGRSLALRERKRREGSGGRSRPHPAEPSAGGAARSRTS